MQSIQNISCRQNIWKIECLFRQASSFQSTGDVPESGSGNARCRQFLQIWIRQIFAGFLPDLIAVLAYLTQWLFAAVSN
jgi:hypothetical protein